MSSRKKSFYLVSIIFKKQWTSKGFTGITDFTDLSETFLFVRRDMRSSLTDFVDHTDFSE